MKPGPHTAEFFLEQISRLERKIQHLEDKLRHRAELSRAIVIRMTELGDRMDDARYHFLETDPARKIATDIVIEYGQIVQSVESLATSATKDRETKP